MYLHRVSRIYCLFFLFFLPRSFNVIYFPRRTRLRKRGDLHRHPARRLFAAEISAVGSQGNGLQATGFWVALGHRIRSLHAHFRNSFELARVRQTARLQYFLAYRHLRFDRLVSRILSLAQNQKNFRNFH